MKKGVLGYSLMEVLICFLILSFIMVIFNSTQVTSLKKMRDAYFFSQAENQITNFINTSFLSLAEWNKQNREVLPEGTGTKTQNKVALFWNGKQKQCHQEGLDCLEFSL